MEQRSLGRSGLKVSEISFGPGNWSITDEGEALRMIGRALDLGVTTFDTANFESGGRIEEWIGRAIHGRRHEVVLCTKFSGGASRRHIMREVEGSLRRLGIECIDLYQFHAWDRSTPIEESLSALTTLVRQGKVLYLGCCWFTSWQICKTNWMAERHGCEPLVSISPKFNLLGQDIFYPYTLGEVLEKDLIPFCIQEGIGVIGYRPLAAERGETLAQFALAWALSQPGISSVLVGANSMAQLEENLAAAGHRLTEAEMRQVDDIRRPLKGLVI